MVTISISPTHIVCIYEVKEFLNTCPPHKTFENPILLNILSLPFLYMCLLACSWLYRCIIELDTKPEIVPI